MVESLGSAVFTWTTVCLTIPLKNSGSFKLKWAWFCAVAHSASSYSAEKQGSIYEKDHKSDISSDGPFHTIFRQIYSGATIPWS